MIVGRRYKVKYVSGDQEREIRGTLVARNPRPHDCDVLGFDVKGSRRMLPESFVVESKELP